MSKDKTTNDRQQQGKIKPPDVESVTEERRHSSQPDINIHIPPPDKPDTPPSILPTWLTSLIQLGILGTLVVIGIWVGTISTTVKENGEMLKKIDTAVLDPNTGMSVRLARIESSVEAKDD